MAETTETAKFAIQSVCVYCGSRTGNKPYFAEMATELGHLIAENRMNLVYGAGSVGLMGITARAAIEKGGRVVGIIPEHLDSIEITQEGLSELHITRNMHDRKKMMFDRSDAFIVLPGGLGTLDETLEVMTWAQLSLHRKPIILLNQNNYWSPLLELINHVVDDGFASEANRALLHVVETAEDALAYLRAFNRTDTENNSNLF
ncbi:TIGR00730 family Rossman fold protein [Kordiimonas sp. SCSIO 12610]|uniref:LOG family protein n=1 Tax=Kordiimonas sp. SCSIO 12610 TaxID=2829597 RepID=UPI002109EEFB|nr:TIGR00730 family Rossman fold protein [Kordiimonas sp. SCSIO 12610]UTW53797.1 TIGR00730 family Rossman fold protein [Kordiimonas sp. SCSIO 12610]